MEPHRVIEANAERISRWLRERGGLAIWSCLDLGNLGQTWTTPLRQENGEPTPRPHWSASKEPVRIITDPSEVVVSKDVEVKRFHIAVRLGSQGFKLKVSDGGSRRIRREVAKAGEGAYHVFDYSTQEAVIMKPESTEPLTEWEKRNGRRAG